MFQKLTAPPVKISVLLLHRLLLSESSLCCLLILKYNHSSDFHLFCLYFRSHVASFFQNCERIRKKSFVCGLRDMRYANNPRPFYYERFIPPTFIQLQLYIWVLLSFFSACQLLTTFSMAFKGTLWVISGRGHFLSHLHAVSAVVWKLSSLQQHKFSDILLDCSFFND